MTQSCQVKDIIESPNLHLSSEIAANEGVLDEIHCGVEFRKLRETGQLGENAVSLLWNCDGIPIFKSLKSQV